nr:MAG TPA: Protein of unknown function (DUF722) [Caudoviricetes sp.]
MVNQKYNLGDMSITKIKSKIEELNNKLDFYLSKKEQSFNMTQPKSSKLKDINVSGGQRVNLFEKYVMTNEELDPIIEFLQDEIRLLESYLSKELKRIGEYSEWEQKIIYLREKGNTWLYIAFNTPFSKSTCQRIYRNYKRKRNV